MSEKGNSTSTKELIKECFWTLLLKSPDKTVTVREVVEKCNISRSTFYFYYEDIAALYRDCEQEIFDVFETDRSEFILYTIGKDFQKYTEYCIYHLSRLEKIQKKIKCILMSPNKGHFMEKWIADQEKGMSKMMTFSDNPNSVQQKQLTRFFASGQTHVLADWIMNDCKQPMKDIAFVSAQMLFKGVYPSDN